MSDFFGSSSEEVNFASTVDYEIVRTNERVREVARELRRESLLAVDTENAGIDPHRKWALLLQIGTSKKCYIFEHYRTTLGTKFDSYPKELDLAPIKELLEDPSILKVLFQAKYDWRWLFVHYGIRMRNICCLQVVERLLTVGLPNARRRPALRELALKYLGINLRKEARSGFIDRDPEADPIVEKEFAYSAGDVVLLPEIYHQVQPHIDKWGLQRVCRLEFDVLPAVARAEVAGVLVNQERWRALVVKAKEKHRKVSGEVYKCFEGVVAQKTLFGIPTFNIGSQPQLLKNLKKLGFDLPDTEEATLKRYRDKPSATRAIAKRREAFKHLLDWRGLNKILTSYSEKFLGRINPETGRLHCEFNQVEADTGRMSSSKPNLQQVPGFDPDDPDSLDFRGCFEARPGYRLVTADFSQQELRILADMSGDPTFRKAYTTFSDEGLELDVHRYTASVIFNVPYDEVTKVQRGQAKILNFFLVYGGGAYSLSATLKITEDEAQKIIDDYFKRYDRIKHFLDSRANAALNDGYSETISGRKRFLTAPSPDDPIFKRARAAIRRKGKNCVDSLTEALTIDRGWVRGFDLLPDDTILTKNSETGILEWQKLTDLKLFPEEEGTYYKIRSKSFEAITTPTHRWLVRDKATGRDVCRTTEELSEWGDHRIHRTGRFTGIERGVHSDCFVELCGWFITDGSYESRPRKTKPARHCVHLGQSARANPEKVERIKQLLGKIDSRAWECKPNLRTEVVKWTLSEDLSGKLHSLFPERELTLEFMRNLTKTQIKILFDVMKLGDGSVVKSGKSVFTAGTEKAAGGFQILCTLAGYSSHAYARDMSKYTPQSTKLLNVPNQGSCWYVNVLSRDRVQVNKGQKEKFVGKVAVWCPIVPNTYFVARRQGQVFITGNTPIQGSGADVTKQAMAFLFRALEDRGYDATILMIVHDEFVVEVREDQAEEVARIVEEEMIRGFSHFFKTIPMRVDVHSGFTWEK